MRVLTVLLATMAMGAAPAGAEVLSIPVRFPVENVNRTGIPCSSDGQRYVLRGELVGPRAVLTGTGPAAATVYLHEYGFDDFWHFRAFPAVDYATHMAKAGAVSVTLDRLGYDDSPRPDGSDICIGSQVDMAHQVVQQVRTAAYEAEGIEPRRFERVALGGHSVGAIIAEAVAHTFADVDALVLFGHSDGDYSPGSLQVGVAQGTDCAGGGEPGPPGHYAFFGTEEESRALGYGDADPAVVDAQVAQRHPDPCGDVNSLIPAIAVNNERVGEISVGVLLLYGREDATLAADAPEQQRQAYTGSDDVETAFFDGAGHALVIERAAPLVRAAVQGFLSERGLIAAPRLRVRGVPRAGCVDRAFRVRVHAPAGGASVWLDRRRLARSDRQRFSVRVPARRLAPGRHRIVVAAGDLRRARAFRRC
jgi:pimeloyl-ACP methyl ester carboxylesterase